MANILIADSDSRMRELLVRALHSEGHTLYSAENGGQAASILESHPIHLLVVDRGLPELDLEDLIRKHAGPPRFLPVVVLTAPGNEDEDALLDAGARLILPLPLDLEQAAAEIRKIIPAAANLPPPAEEAPPPPPPRPRKIRMFAALFTALLAGAGLFFMLRARRSQVPTPLPAAPRAYSVPYANLSGLVWADGSLWTCDWYLQRIYRHRTDDGLTARGEYEFPDWRPTALAWDGKNLWSCSTWNRAVARHADRPPFAIEKQWSVPDGAPVAFGYDGRAFWMATDSRRLQRFSVRNDAIAVSSDTAAPGDRVSGLAWDGTALWVADSGTGQLFRLDPARGMAVSEISWPPPEIQNDRLSGLSWDGTNFWIGDESARRVYRVPRGSLNVSLREPFDNPPR